MTALEQEIAAAEQDEVHEPTDPHPIAETMEVDQAIATEPIYNKEAEIATLKLLVFVTDSALTLLSMEPNESIGQRAHCEVRSAQGGKITHVRVHNDTILVALQGGIVDCYKVTLVDDKVTCRLVGNV